MPTPQTEQAEQNQVEQIDIEDLDIRQGTTVEVLTMENRLTFVGKVESFRNGAVIVREAKGNDLPPVLFNKEIKMRFYQNGRSLVLYGKVCGSTNTIWKLDRLQSSYVTEQRVFFRQRISPKVMAKCTLRDPSGREGRAADCQVLDISAGGMLISSKDKEDYKEGDRLSITEVQLVKGERPFDFGCCVRRAGQRERGVIRYGCQFDPLPPKEQDRLLRAIFTVQREELKIQKDRAY